LILGLVLALVLSSCGSGDNAAGPTSQSPSAAPTVDPDDLDRLTTDILDQWGPEDGFAVLLLALDAGYSLHQMLAAPIIEADGTITGVAPDGENHDLVELAGPASAPGLLQPAQIMAVVFAARQGQGDDKSPADAYIGFIDLTAAELWSTARQNIRDQVEQEAAEREEAAEIAGMDAFIIGTVVNLAARGYTPEQIMEAIVLNSVWLRHVDAEDSSVVCYSIVEEPFFEDDDGPTSPAVRTPAGSDLLRGTCPPVESGPPDESGSTSEEQGAADDVDLDEAPTTWSGEIIPSSPPLQRMDRPVDGFVAIDRREDGTYELEAYVEFEYDTGVIGGTCTTLVRRSTSAVAAMANEKNEFRFSGTDSWEDLESDCPTNPYSDNIDTAWPVTIEGDTATGICCGGMDYTIEREP
jgi:hypothetical protein